MRGQQPARRGGEILFGAAGIGNQRNRRQRLRQRGKHTVVLSHRHGNQHRIGAFDRRGNIFLRFIDDAEFERTVDVGPPPADADHSGHPAGTAQRRGHRPADQAHTDDDQPVAMEIAQGSSGKSSR